MNHDNWLFLVFAGIAVLFQLLSRATSKSNKDGGPTRPGSTPAPPALPRETRTDSQGEQIRKFLEALGRPTSSPPPPVVRPRADIPPRTVAPVQPPRVFTPAVRKIVRAEKRADEPGDWLKTINLPREAPPEPTPPHVYVPPAPEPAIPPSAPRAVKVVRREDKIDIVSLLRSPTGLRDAMVLREVFGPPRSLQDVDLIGIA